MNFPYGFHTAGYAPPDQPGETRLPRQPTYKIYCKANDNYCLSVRDGNVVLAPTNKNDGYQVNFTNKLATVCNVSFYLLINCLR